MARTWAWGVWLAAMLAGYAAMAAEVVVEVDGGRTFDISPFIYGMNQPEAKGACPNVPLRRMGGNRMTAYNWETNASNAGSDWQHQNDGLMSSSNAPGEAVRRFVAGAQQAGAACIVTVPIAGYVAADKNGGGDVAKTADYLNKRFHISPARKGTPFAEVPDLADGKVYQDEFVHWLEKAFPRASRDARKAIFYALDNEPDLWAHTHARIHPQKVTYEEVARRNAEYAAAIKAVVPEALVFGFVSYGWHGFTTLQNAPDRKGRDFLDYYLAEMAAAEKKAGRRLVDVLDLHWYPEARGGGARISEEKAEPAVAAARLQAPRSLWDPAYKEESWIAKDVLRAPIQLMPRIREKISKHYPGTKLAITEYNYGGGNHISGGLAQADVLGIFGREGVFAAAHWKLSRGEDRFTHGAFALYRNYDVKGGSFGDKGCAATCSDTAASAYASLDAAGRLIVIAINKTAEPMPMKLRLSNCPAATAAALYRMDASSPAPQPAGEAKVAGGTVSVELPALSATTMVFVQTAGGGE